MRFIRPVLCLLPLLLMTTGATDAGDNSEVLSNFAAANVVIGQKDFISMACNHGGADNLCTPEGAPAVGGGKLYIADSDDSRVLGFKKVPKANDASANFVLGEPDFSTVNFAVGPSEFSFPVRVAASGNKLFVVDFDNSRVLIWNKLPTKTETPANVVVGQPNFNSSTSATTRSGLNLPEGMAAAKGMLFVSDRNNNRIMIWNHVPTANGADADVVVGQSDFTHSASDLTRTGLNEPEGLWSDGTRLVAADRGNNRVLIWNHIPTTNGAPADVVVGQTDFTSRDSPDPPTSQSLSEPADVASDGKRLFVADFDNRRMLVYSPFPTANNPAATVVLGQADFTHNKGGPPTAKTVGSPFGVSLSGKNLFVTDTDDSRVLIFSAK